MRLSEAEQNPLGRVVVVADLEPLAIPGAASDGETGVSRPLDRSRPSSGLLVIQEREIAAQDEILQIFYTYTSDGGPE